MPSRPARPRPDPYLRHFGLRAQPFGLNPGVEHLYLGRQHGEALAGLQVGIRQRRGLITLIGEVGMGKTTIARAVLRQMSERVLIGYTATTTLRFDQMMQPVLRDLGLAEIPEDKAEIIWRLTELLKTADRKGRIVALIVDEAHYLSEESFEELRQLLNVETDEAKLLQLVLVGQPELDDRLADPRLRHVADRVAVRCMLNPLSRSEAREYLDTRLVAAGGSLDLFAPAALRSIFDEARGVPRSLNVLCHNALLFAFGDDSRRVEASHAKTAIQERRGKPLVRLARGGRRSLWPAAAGLVAGGVIVGLSIGMLGREGARPSADAAGEASIAEPSERETGVADSSPTPPGETASSATTDPGEVGSSSPSSSGAAGSFPTPVPGETAEPPRAPSEDARIVQVEQGSNLTLEIERAYGEFDLELLSLVLDANPELTDPGFLPTGFPLVLPPRPRELPGGSEPQAARLP